MNNISIIGRLTKDPEGKLTSNQKAFCRFSVAVDRGYKDSNGNKPVDFLPCIAWNEKSNIITRYFKKGSQIGITGSLEMEKYTDNTGSERISYIIQVASIDFLTPKKEVNSEEPKAEPEPPKVEEPAISPVEDMQQSFELPFMDDSEEGDIPFEV